MSIITLFTRQAPTLGGISFDAVLEDTFEASVEITDYPIESGARAADHIIIKPFRWRLVGAMSNNPLRPELTDFVGLLTNQVDDSGILSLIGGISAGLLGGSADTRSSSALSALIALMVTGEPFTINAGDIQRDNMVIIDITRVKTPENEGGLEFEAQLQELPTLDTITGSSLFPNQSLLRAGDPAQTQITNLINKGEISTQPATTSQTAAAQAVL